MPPPVDDEQRVFSRTSGVVRASRGGQTQVASTHSRFAANTSDSVYAPAPPTRRLNFVGQSLSGQSFSILHCEAKNEIPVPGIFPRGSPLISVYDSDDDSLPRRADEDLRAASDADQDPRSGSEESDSDSSARSWDSDAIAEAAQERAGERRRLGVANVLDDDTLYLNDHRPSPSPATFIDAFRCSICFEIFSHPVLYSCGHTHCYVCIRPVPHRHYAFEQAIAQLYPEWVDSSNVAFSFPELVVPTPPANAEELREKARERMARRRAALDTLDVDSAEAKHAKERARAASRKYREANRSKIVESQRMQRWVAFNRTHTIEETAAQRAKQLQRQEMVAQEEMIKRIFKGHGDV
ncbi:hypothetical protein C8F01DRAFT_1370865 [Mycena amicta]|nr:hypothetical protein C8F01DRAFT_1370865 [Mycena amicta]